VETYFAIRTQKAAHWEIRKVMGDLLVRVQTIVPVVFDDFVEAGSDQNGIRYFQKLS
jgi:thymidylate synthase ThyX